MGHQAFCPDTSRTLRGHKLVHGSQASARIPPDSQDSLTKQFSQYQSYWLAIATHYQLGDFIKSRSWQAPAASHLEKPLVPLSTGAAGAIYALSDSSTVKHTIREGSAC